MKKRTGKLLSCILTLVFIFQGLPPAFSMTADANGVATKMILMRVDGSVSEPSATFRRKSGSANKLTQTYALG